MLRAAMAYAAAGWPVHPCKKDSKEPATRHGFKDATTDQRRIRGWWEEDPGRNVAIPTGAPGPDVLDVDVRPDGDGWAAFNRLKRAGLLNGARALVRTPSGGLHAYFAGSSQPCGRLARHHLDFKSSGGYVVAPPSVAGGRPYEVLDHRPGTGMLDWGTVCQLLDDESARQRPDRAEPDPGSVRRLIEWVGRQNRPGDRHYPLVWAAFRLLESGHLDAAVADDLIAASVRAGHDERHARHSVQSILRKAASR
jgi:Bifunctional DNA primase/polymerase, N-terminal